MLEGLPCVLETDRLILRPLAPEHAPAFWEVLSDPEIYQWIPRAPPDSPGSVATRFARIAQPIVPGRDEQWLNWTVWSRENDEALGLVEATVHPSRIAHIAYMFAPRVWGRGYATEAVAAALAVMTKAGAAGFEAVIDTRNARSIALVQRLGFAKADSRPSTGMPEANDIVFRKTLNRN